MKHQNLISNFSILRKLLLISTPLLCLSSIPSEASFEEAERPQKQTTLTRRHGIRLGQRGGPELLDTTFKKAVIVSIQAREDLITPLLQELRPRLRELSSEVHALIRFHFKELIKEKFSLQPHTFFHSTVAIRIQESITPDHYEFERLKGILKSLNQLASEPVLSPVAGLLTQLHDYYQQYQLQLCSLSRAERATLLSGIATKGNLFEKPFLITLETAYMLLSMDEYGIITKRNRSGSSPNVNLRNTYFKKALFFEKEGQKVATLDPSMEWAIGYFHSRLFGEGVAPSTFLVFPQVPYKQPIDGAIKAQQLVAKINDPTESPQRAKRIQKLHEDEELKRQFTSTAATFSAQASQTIPGILLEDFLLEAQHNPQIFKTLDQSQVQELLLSLMLTNPNDAKGDNFIVTSEEKNRKIISIDNDLSFAARIVTAQPPNGGPFLHFPEVRNLLFMVPYLMDQPLLREVRNRFLNQEPTIFILKWLEALEAQNQRYKGLEADLGAQNFKLFHLPFHFQAGTIQRVYQDWLKLQQALTIKQEVTPQELLEALSPLLGAYYCKLRTTEDYIRNFYRCLYPEPQRSIEDLFSLDTILTDGNSVKESLKKEHALEDDFKKRTQSIQGSLRELIDAFDPLRLSSSELKAILEEVRQIFPNALEKALFKVPLSRLVPSSPSNNLLDSLFTLIPERLHEIEENSLFSPLHQAINLNNNKLVSYLLSKGASPHQRTKDHRLPLDLACEKEAEDIFKILVDAGAKKVNVAKALKFYHKLTSISLAYPSFMTLARRHQELNWILSINTLLPEKGKGMLIQTASFGHRMLPQLLYNQLFTEKGEVIAENNSGRHAVGRLTVAQYNLPLTLYFKAYPELPGLEEAVGEFIRHLLGFGAPYAELMRVNNIPVLMSQGIQGPTLAHVLKDAPQILDLLDTDALSSLFLATMLINPEDGKADNYIVETLATGKLRIIAIDNDHAFVPAVCPQPQRRSFMRAEPIVQVKSILYCLDQFKEPVSKGARDQILSINAGKMLEEWLKFLHKRNASYGKLFSEQERLNLIKQDSYIGIPFKEGFITNLYKKVIYLQEVLQQYVTITHEGLLKLLEPDLAYRYNKGFEKPASVLERFKAIDGASYGKGALGEPLTFTMSGHILKALNIPLKESLINLASFDSTKAQDYCPNKAIQELKGILTKYRQTAFTKIGTLNIQHLETLSNENLMTTLRRQSFTSLSLNDQRVLFELLKGRKLEELIIKNAAALTTKIILTYPQLNTLLSVNLSGCINLTDKIIEPLSKQAWKLNYLNLSKISKLKQFGKASSLTEGFITFPALKTLILNESGLRGIYLNAACLQHFEAQQCVRLKRLKINASQLVKLVLNGAHNINEEDLRVIIASQSRLHFLEEPEFPRAHIKYLTSREALSSGKLNYKSIQNPCKGGPLTNNTGWQYEKKSSITQNGKKTVFLPCDYVIQKFASTQNLLGLMYERGTGVEKDEKEAANWYAKAAEQGHAAAQHKLGWRYLNGEQTEQDDKKAAFWFYKAAEQGYAPSHYTLGWMYTMGKGFNVDDTEAAEWYRKAAVQGLVDAQYTLGWIYQNGKGIEQDDSQAAEWFLKAAEQGDSDAQYALGLMYQNGKGIEQDDSQAAKWFLKAADQEDSNAQNELGLMYFNGRGVNQDNNHAVKYLLQSAQGGHQGAQLNLGILLRQESSLHQDIKEAIKWFEQAAEKDSAEAAYQLSQIYRNIRGKHSYFLKYLEQAAILYHREAAYKMARYYAKCMPWNGWYSHYLKIAAEQNHPKALQYYKHLKPLAFSLNNIGLHKPLELHSAVTSELASLISGNISNIGIEKMANEYYLSINESWEGSE